MLTAATDRAGSAVDARCDGTAQPDQPAGRPGPHGGRETSRQDFRFVMSSY